MEAVDEFAAFGRQSRRRRSSSSLGRPQAPHKKLRLTPDAASKLEAPEAGAVCVATRTLRRPRPGRSGSGLAATPVAAAADGPARSSSSRPSRPGFVTRGDAAQAVSAPPGAPPGPESLEEALDALGDAARRIVAKARDSGVDLRTLEAVRFAITSSYSGWGGGEIGGSSAKRHLVAASGVSISVAAHCATDCNKWCRRAVGAHKADTRPTHRMEDVLARAPPDICQKLERLRLEYQRIVTRKSSEPGGNFASLVEEWRKIRRRGPERVGKGQIQQG